MTGPICFSRASSQLPSHLPGGGCGAEIVGRPVSSERSTLGTLPPFTRKGGRRRWSRTVAGFVVAVLIGAAAGGAAIAQESMPSAEPAALYKELCGMCHRAGGMGTGLLARRMPAERAQLEQRDDLPPQLVAAAVRFGVGNMPPLSRAEVSDAALEAIAAYLAEGPHGLENAND